MEKNNSIINSLKRLERVGEETSIVTEKLKKSCEEVATKVLNICTDNLEFSKSCFSAKESGCMFSSFELPDGIIYARCNFEHGGWLMINNNYDEFDYKEYSIDHKASRNNALKFSRMIADGWLDKFTEYLEARNRKTKEALKDIEEVNNTLQKSH